MVRYEVSFYIDSMGPYPFACVRAWSRREAYFEVIHDMRASAIASHPLGKFTWDATEIK